MQEQEDKKAQRTDALVIGLSGWMISKRAEVDDWRSSVFLTWSNREEDPEINSKWGMFSPCAIVVEAIFWPAGRSLTHASKL